jgi:8-amino-7-oxononanoate synthase
MFLMDFLKKKRDDKSISGMEEIRQILDYADKHDLYPDIKVISSAVEPEVIIDGKKFLMFSSNNYLGLATHPKVKEAAIKATQKYGTGSTGSRLLSGNINIYLELEKKLADFKKGEDAIVFPTGFAANLGTISAIMDPLKVTFFSFFQRQGVVLSDELNHASIIDGCWLSKQKIVIYKHRDVNHLESLLKKYKKRRKLIVTDSVFSMDGDVAPLDKISELAKKYNATTMIDEAHATGVLGENGRGATEHFGLKVSEDISIIMGTLSKAIGSCGGYVVGSKELIKYLRVAARSYMFSTAMPPAAAAAAIAAIDIIQSDRSFLKKMWDNVHYLKRGFEKMGFNTLGSESSIIPILIGKDEDAIRISRMFFEKNIFAPCVRWPAVARNIARIRFTVTSSHTKEQISCLINTAKLIKEKLNIVYAK